MPRRSPTPSTTPTRTSPGLSRARVVTTAIRLADKGGLDGVSMRRLGQELGVDPMSLYHHVRDKDDLLDGMVDEVIQGIDVAADPSGWKASLRATILGARATVLRHPWVPAVIEARQQPGPATLRYMDGVLAILREGGFSVDLGHHTLHVLGSRILGFGQDLFDDRSDGTRDAELAAVQARQMARVYPRLGELALAVTHEGGLGGCDDDVEFLFGLDLILDGLETLQRRTVPADR